MNTNRWTPRPTSPSVRALGSCLALATLLSCSLWGADPTGKTISAPPAPPAPTAEELEAANPVRPLPDKPLGHDQDLTQVSVPPDPEKARLGRWLFFDTRLSRDQTLSCASCHKPENAFSEPTPVSTGINGQKGNRKAPSFVNAVYAFFPETFWDGRAASLEAQAIGPIANPIEMGFTHEEATAAIAGAKGYGPFFQKAFGDSKVTLDRIASAIAHYERTRVSGNSPYDRWKRGVDEKAVGDDVKLGEDLFFGKALCSRCHVGNSFTDSRYHNLGVGWDEKTQKFADKGREDFTGKESDRGAFKTPHLRDVALHAPYMHDGSMATLEEVVDHYVKGGHPNPYLSPKMEKIELSAQEAAALVGFMKALTGEGYQDEAPALFPQ